MEESSNVSGDSLNPMKKRRFLSLPSYLKKAKPPTKNPKKILNSAGLRVIFKPFGISFSKVPNTSMKLSKMDSLGNFSPLLSEGASMNRSKDSYRIPHLPSQVISKNQNCCYPSLCNISIREIIHKKQERSSAFLFNKETSGKEILKNPINQLEVSPHKLMRSVLRSSKKNIKFPSIMEIHKKMEQNSKELFEKMLEQHFLFRNFTQNSKERIFKEIRCYEVDSMAFLLKEDSFAERIYFLESGLVGVYKRDTLSRHIKVGQFIGEEQIFSVSVLSSSYKCLEKSLVWGIQTHIIAKIMMEANEKKYKENREFLIPIPYFSSLDDSQIDEICYNMSAVRFQKGTLVAKEGEVYVNFYIIKDGVALANADNKFSHYLKKGEFFGHNFSIVKGEPFSILVDSEYLECLCINTLKFRKILGGDFENIVSHNLTEIALKSSELFRKLSNIEITRIVEKRSLVCFPKNKIIPLGSYIYVLIDGTVHSKYGEKDCLRGAFFGEEKMLLGEEIKEKITCKEDSLLAMISTKDIEEILGCDIKKLAERQNIEEKYSIFRDYKKESRTKINVDFAKTKIVRILGEGLSGLVLLAEYEGVKYALKIVSKGWVIENHYESYLRNEKIIQERIDFSFITKTITTCKDDLSLYFFMEYVKGIDLFEILSLNQEIDDSAMKFYVGSILVAIEYLHRKGIIHRDLKPENILVDETGYIKLCDLGFSKILMKISERTYTIVGTPHYMAPEMMSMKGYSFPVDHYAIGVITYVLYFGEFPFGEGLEDTYEIYNAVLTQKLRFPKHKSINENFKTFLKKILKKNPEARMGRNCESCRYQKWLEGYPWEHLIEKKIEPPFVPEINERNEDKLDNLSLFDLIQNNDIKDLKDLTKELPSNFPDWDNIF